MMACDRVARPRDPSRWAPRKQAMDMIPQITAPPVEHETQSVFASEIVRDGVRRYFAERRERVGPFVDRNFSLRGSIELHRSAIGWDIARGPLNLTMAGPQFGLLLAAKAAGRLGATRMASSLGRKRLVVHTAVAKELAWRLHTDLLEL